MNWLIRISAAPPAMRHTFKLFAVLLAAMPAQSDDTKLWYDKPAVEWMKEALPVGNGDLGALVLGKTDTERIVFNEKSLWTGTNGMLVPTRRLATSC